MPNMDEIAAHAERIATHAEKIATSLGMRNCLIIIGILILGVLFLFSRGSGWHEVSRHYPALSRYEGGWLFDGGLEFRFNNSHSENAIRLGADGEGLYLSMWIGFRPFHPPIFVPWSDVIGVGAKGAPWSKKQTLVQITFASCPGIPLEVDRSIAEEIEKRSEGRWKMPKLD